jgi:hypothetical protein
MVRSRALLLVEWEIENGDAKQFNHYLAGRKPYDFAVMRRWHEHLMMLYPPSPTAD